MLPACRQTFIFFCDHVVMSMTPVPCPVCRRPAELVVRSVTVAPDVRRRKITLRCEANCSPSEAHLLRLTDPMAC